MVVLLRSCAVPRLLSKPARLVASVWVHSESVRNTSLERKWRINLARLEVWKFHVIGKGAQYILQSKQLAAGFALSRHRYGYSVNRGFGVGFSAPTWEWSVRKACDSQAFSGCVGRCLTSPPTSNFYSFILLACIFHDHFIYCFDLLCSYDLPIFWCTWS